MGEIPPHARFRIVELSPIGLLATGDAWGEWGAEDSISATGLNDVPQYIARGFSWDALLPYYSLQGLPDVVGYILSAVIGVAVMVIVFRLLALAVCWCVGRADRRIGRAQHRRGRRCAAFVRRSRKDRAVLHRHDIVERLIPRIIHPHPAD